jgi:hypothetical protein
MIFRLNSFGRGFSPLSNLNIKLSSFTVLDRKERKDISKSGLVVEEGSAIWDSDTATICTRLELLSDESGSASAISMTYLGMVMQLKVDLTSDFTTTIDTVLQGGTGTPV